MKIFGSILILLFCSCYKKDTVDCEIIGKVCKQDNLDGTRECEIIIECKTW